MPECALVLLSSNLSLSLSLLLLLLLWLDFLYTVPLNQTEALMQFYHATNGQQWNNNTNWLRGDPCADDWFGVTCVHDRTVVQTLYVAWKEEVVRV
jgi:hypothetical protein